MRARSRGQATVELAVASVVFVVVLLVGIHFAELGQLSLKVQEAQAFAVWSAAGRRVQKREVSGSTDTTPFNRTIGGTSGVAQQAKDRYRDFDGLTSSTGRSDVVIRALTKGSGLDVTCTRDNSLSFRPSPAARPVLLDEGGLRCTSSAQIEAIRIPHAFMQRGEGGSYRASPFRTSPMVVCGMGLASGGSCEGTLAIMTNDWGLAKDETKTCRLTCADSKYRGEVSVLFAGGGGAGASFASTYAGAAPASANEFWFSYSGIDAPSPYMDFVGGESTPMFKTGGPAVPGGMVSQFRTAGKCFLGRSDCP